MRKVLVDQNCLDNHSATSKKNIMQQHFLSASYLVFRVDALGVNELTKRQEEKCCKRKCKRAVVILSNHLRATADEQNKIQLRFRSSVEGHIQLTAPTRKAGFAASCDFLFVKKISHLRA
jgi:hypothetical protein